MSAGTVFPVFIRAEYRDDGSAKSALLSSIDNMLGSAEKRFTQYSAEASRQLSAALSAPRTAGGSLNLDVAGQRAAADAARARAVAARELAAATAIAAKENGDYSASTRLAVQALQAQAREEEQAAQAALSHARAVEQVQSVLNRQASATDAVVRSGRLQVQAGTDIAASADRQRFAYNQLGFQVNDVVTSLASGASLSTVFAQQAGQIGQALQLLAGPSGAAGAGAALTALNDNVADAGETYEQAKAATDSLTGALGRDVAAHQAVAGSAAQDAAATRGSTTAHAEGAVAANAQATATARSAAANSADAAAAAANAAATGRLAAAKASLVAFLAGPWGAAVIAGTVVLGTLAAKAFETKDAMIDVKFATNAMGDAQSILGGVLDLTTGKVNTQNSALIALAKAQLLVAQVQAKTRIAEARRGVATIQDRPVQLSGGLGGGFSAQRRERDARDTIAADVLAGKLDSATAVQRLENLRRVGRLTDEQFTAAAASVANLGVEIENLKVYGEAGKLLDGTGGRSLLKPDKPKKPPRARTGDGGAAVREEFGEDARDKIAGIAEQFSKVPSAVQSAIKTTRQLDDIIDDLARKKPVNFEATIADAKAAKNAIADAIVRPFEDAQRNADRQFEIQRLTLAGRNAEAAALESIFTLEDKLGSEEVLRAKAVELVAKGRTAEAAVLQQILAAYPELKQQARDLAELEEQRGRALERAREIQGAYLDATRSIRGEVEALLSGTGKLGNFKQIFRQLQGRVLTEKLFGPIFKEIERAVLKDTGVDAAVDKLAKDTTRAGNSALAFADTLDLATRRIAGATTGGATLGNANAAGAGLGFLAAIVGGAAGIGAGGNTTQGGLQPNGDILVPRDRLPKDSVAGMTPATYAELVANSLTRPLLKGLDGLIPGLSGVIGGALSGYVTGGLPGGVLGALKEIPGIPDKLKGVFGKALEGAQTGTAIAGIGKALGIKTSTTGAQIGGAIGSALPIPGGQIIGSIAGGLIGGLFKRAKTGTATLSIGSDGVQVGSTGGNSGSRTKAASTAGDSVSDSLNRIAQQLGGSADGPISVSIGIRDKNFRVDTAGTGKTKKSAGAIDFGQDQAAALKFAVADAIKDGVITGISAGAQRLLQGGKDVDRQLQKALDFEGTLARAKALRDPVGAALDTLDKEFTRLRSIFTEAGASAAEYADLEKLYGAERAQAVKQATESLTGSLRGLLDDLTVGNDALSLRDRKSAALAKFDPLEARVKAGDTTAFDDYADAARSLLDIERQFSGSQGGYFSLLERVKATTQGRLDGFDAIAASSIGRDSPLSSNPLPIDNANVVNAIADQTTALLDGLGVKLDALISNQGRLLSLSGPSQTPLYLPQVANYF